MNLMEGNKGEAECLRGRGRERERDSEREEVRHVIQLKFVMVVYGIKVEFS